MFHKNKTWVHSTFAYHYPYAWEMVSFPITRGPYIATACSGVCLWVCERAPHAFLSLSHHSLHLHSVALAAGLFMLVQAFEHEEVTISFHGIKRIWVTGWHGGGRTRPVGQSDSPSEYYAQTLGTLTNMRLSVVRQQGLLTPETLYSPAVDSGNCPK